MDTIRRKDAIDALCDNCNQVQAVCPHYPCKQYTSIERLPFAEPRWIPCSERLPERGVSVLISHVGYVSEDYLDIDDGAMCFWISGIDLDEELNNLAWMPLPAPWKGGRE